MFLAPQSFHIFDWLALAAQQPIKLHEDLFQLKSIQHWVHHGQYHQHQDRGDDGGGRFAAGGRWTGNGRRPWPTTAGATQSEQQESLSQTHWVGHLRSRGLTVCSTEVWDNHREKENLAERPPQRQTWAGEGSATNRWHKPPESHWTTQIYRSPKTRGWRTN